MQQQCYCPDSDAPSERTNETEIIKETTKSCSESQQNATTTVEAQSVNRTKSTEKVGGAGKEEQDCRAENQEQLDLLHGPEQHGMTEEEQAVTPEKPQKTSAAEHSAQDRAPESSVENVTAEKPDQAGKSEKDEPQSNLPNKRLRFGPSQRNKSGPRAKNGSYRNYYARRYNGIHGDDRIPIVRDACKLQGKKISILDVGCNDGTVTIEMASMDRCLEAVGIDIDPNLVGAARKNVQEFVEKEAKTSQTELANPCIQGPIPKENDSLPLSLRRSLHLMKEAQKNHEEDGTATGKASTPAEFPHNVTFRREDFAQKAPTRTSVEIGKYDVVLCLSVTKWVHFAKGDEGLKLLFRRLHACLKPGGVLVLEPQPQKSYKSAIRKGLGRKDFKGERKLKPHRFVEYLTKTVGFTKMRMLRDVRHREAFLGVVPSDDEGDEGQQQEAQMAPQAQEAPEEHDHSAQNGMEFENVDSSIAEEVRQDGGEDDKEDARINKNDDGDREHEKQEAEVRTEPESTSQGTSSRPSQAEGDTSLQQAPEGNEAHLTEYVNIPSSSIPNCEDTAQPSAGSKRRSTEQIVERVK